MPIHNPTSTSKASQRRQAYLSTIGGLLGLAQLSCFSGGPGQTPPDEQDNVGERRSYVYAAETEGFLVYSPNEKRNNPLAGSASYIYLLLGREAVRLQGPTLTGLDATDVDDLFEFRSPTVELRTDGTRALGLDVVINELLSYRFSIEDFEDEGSVIGQGTLIQVDGELRSEFVFAANGSPGVAHNVTIQAHVDGTDTGSPTEPVTIETRYDACESPANIEFIELIEPMRACQAGDSCVVVTAVGDCWHSAVNADRVTEAGTWLPEFYCEVGCESPAPTSAVCEQGVCTALP